MAQYKKTDPHHKREALKYEHPVPSREYILQYLKEVKKPSVLKDLLEAFDLTDHEQMVGLRHRLRAMVRDGELMRDRQGRLALVSELDLTAGRVVGHRDGIGFVIPDNGNDDIFLPPRQMELAFPGDRVLVRVNRIDRRGRPVGTIVEVLTRNTKRLLGRFYKESGVAFVEPDQKNITQKIVIPKAKHAGAKRGQFVWVELTSQPKRNRPPKGEVIEVLGNHLTPGMEVELAIRTYDLPFQWSEVVERKAAQLPTHVTLKARAGRRDLRTLPFVTIDGEDAKDFDDAVYCERKSTRGGWTLWVAIADVTHYLTRNKAMELEAKERGNSVYFPARVIPMFPEALSNELCSLKPNVDRLAMVCEMQLSANGQLQSYEFYEGVIHSHARLTYTGVAEMLAGGEITHPELLPHLKTLHGLYNALKKQRKQRGAIEFDTTETRIVFDDKGKIDSIIPTERNVAHMIIEEAMLLANICAARFLTKHEAVFLYRNHEPPTAEKLTALRDYLKPFGLRLSGGSEPSAKDFARLMERVQKRPDAHILQTVMLRALQQAVYAPENCGHFGLAFDAYAHFTSPIRRYPDIIVHREIKHILKGEQSEQTSEKMQELGLHCSMTERRADEATRDAVNWLKCEYMLDKVGQTYWGIVSGVTGFGLFVELENIFIEGLLHITALRNDYYTFDATHHTLQGKQGGQVYRLGQRLQVTVARVDLDAREIDFSL